VTRALGEQFPAEREADDAVRRVLRSVLWLQFERAAAECEQLEAHCGPPAKLLLPQLVLLFHSASYLLLAAGGRTMAKEGEEDIVRRASAWVAPQAQALKIALRGALQQPGWSSFPSAPTLRLTLRLVGVVAASVTSAESAESARPAPSSVPATPIGAAAGGAIPEEAIEAAAVASGSALGE
ncbi:unnamed protein product, partial [Polarella glacialis]